MIPVPVVVVPVIVVPVVDVLLFSTPYKAANTMVVIRNIPRSDPNAMVTFLNKIQFCFIPNINYLHFRLMIIDRQLIRHVRN